MAADYTQVRQNCLRGMQDLAKNLILWNAEYGKINNLYLTAGPQAGWAAGELTNDSQAKQLLPADVTTCKANMDTVAASISAAILQNLSNLAGTTPYP